MFDRLSRPDNDHFDQRNRSYNRRDNKVVKKVYHVKSNGNLGERSDLNPKAEEPTIEKEGKQKTIGARRSQSRLRHGLRRT